MARELKNIPLKGLFPLPEGVMTAPFSVRALFWKAVGEEALRLKRGEIESGIDRWGARFKPVKRTWGDPTPLIPHGDQSRTYRLLALNFTAQGATLFWRSGGGRESWKTILGYHAYRHGPRSLPVRDVLGLSPRSVEGLQSFAVVVARRLDLLGAPPTPPKMVRPQAKPRPRKPRRSSFEPVSPDSPIGRRLELWTEGDEILERIRKGGEPLAQLRSEIERLKKEYKDLVNSYAVRSDFDYREMEKTLKALENQRADLWKRFVAERDKAFEVLPGAVGIPKNRHGEINIMGTLPERSAPAIAVLNKLARDLRFDIKVELQPGIRAFYNPPKKQMSLSFNQEPSHVIHELGHAIEDNYPEISRAIIEFREYRCKDEVPMDMGSLPNSAHLVGELGRKDKFDDYFSGPDALGEAYYSGKSYGNSPFSEVFTMGLQSLFENPTKFVERDPEWAKFVIGVLRGEMRSYK